MACSNQCLVLGRARRMRDVVSGVPDLHGSEFLTAIAVVLEKAATTDET